MTLVLRHSVFAAEAQQQAIIREEEYSADALERARDESTERFDSMATEDYASLFAKGRELSALGNELQSAAQNARAAAKVACWAARAARARSALLRRSREGLEAMTTIE